MSSVTSPQQAGRGTADIPAPRGGQGVRLLVLGTDDDAQELRDQALAAGLELAQRYSARVSHVAYGAGIDPDDGRYTRIREAGLALVSIQSCAAELGLLTGADSAAEAVIDEVGSASEVGAASEVAQADEPQVEERVGLGADGSSDAEGEPGDCLCAGDESLDFPPLQMSDSAASFVPGFQGDAYADAYAEFDTGVFVAIAADADADDQSDAPHSRNETPLAAAVIGIDPWIGAGATAEPAESGDASIVELSASTSPANSPAQAPANGLGGAPSRAPQNQMLASLAWSLIPLATFGLLTPVSFGYAAFRLRSRSLAVISLGYTVAVLLSFVLSAVRPHSATPADASGALLTLALAVTWIGGTVHALSLRTKVFVS